MKILFIILGIAIVVAVISISKKSRNPFFAKFKRKESYDMVKYIIGCVLSVAGVVLFFLHQGGWGFVLLCVGGFLALTSEYVKETTAETYNNNSVPNCPNCNSNETRKISTIGRVASVETYGLASSTIGKQYICDKCGHKW